MRSISEKAITYPPKKAPNGFPIPPTIAAAKIGSILLKYVTGLKLLSKPYKAPPIVAKIPAITQVTKTIFFGSIPDNKARSSLSE